MTLYVSKPGNLDVRFKQPGPLAKRPALGLALVNEGEDDVAAYVRPAVSLLTHADHVSSVALCVNRDGHWQVDAIVQYEDTEVTAALLEHYPTLSTTTVTPPARHQPVTLRGPAGMIGTGPLLVDDRLRRMVRVAIASSPAVMLVGPPGTGKSTLLREVIAEVQTDPGKLGFSQAPRTTWVTPDGAWTNRELLGGDAADEVGQRRFRPGRVLEAIRRNHWLVLDEANRADMDKIGGGLLTWLAGQEVEVGRIFGEFDAPAVVLGWHSATQPSVSGGSASGAPTSRSVASRVSSRDDVEYRAGREWRLLGTYNTVDTQRRFPFGQALGRRFVRVPVPPIEPALFNEAIGLQYLDVEMDVLKRTGALYAAHQGAPRTVWSVPRCFFGCQNTCVLRSVS